jgi:hypothetical protein
MVDRLHPLEAMRRSEGRSTHESGSTIGRGYGDS